MIPQLGPLPCSRCRRIVLWIRYEGSWWLGERVGTRLVEHRCAA